MQNQPPGPPSGGQPPSYPPPGGPPGYPPAAAGVDKKTGAILSYLLWWITGSVIFLFVGKSDPDVRYHAAQSVVFFGGMTVVFWVIRILGAFFGLPLSILFALVMFALIIYTFVVWIMCLVQAANGNGARFQIPLVGSLVTPYAEQLANAVA
jgi:uncharacterized membrane protein